MQKIKLTDGCPNGCGYCKEPQVRAKYYDLPRITHNEVEILDMNFLANSSWREHVEHLKSCGVKRIQLTCGFDYRRITQEIAKYLYDSGFGEWNNKGRWERALTWAWDYNFGQQRTHKKVWQMLVKAGFRKELLSVFVLTNWMIPYADCLRKKELLMRWNVKINDCCFDGGYRVALHGGCNLYWSLEQIKNFRALSRKHNQIIRFGIDPEYK